MGASYVALAGRIRQALVDVARLVDRAELLMRKTEQSGDDDYLDGIALNLHGFYVGIERIFEDIARSLEGTLPTGPDWHRDLLLQMSAEVASVRPPIIGIETRHCLDEYRGSRHVVRNAYTFHLRQTRLQELVTALHDCYRSTAHDLNSFISFLEKLAGDEI